jgi:hypothetical protein
LSTSHLWQSLPHAAHHRPNVDKTIARHGHGKHTDAQPTEILLECDATIDREENVRARRCDAQQLTILQTGPPFLLGRPDLVVG